MRPVSLPTLLTSLQPRPSGHVCCSQEGSSAGRVVSSCHVPRLRLVRATNADLLVQNLAVSGFLTRSLLPRTEPEPLSARIPSPLTQPITEAGTANTAPFIGMGGPCSCIEQGTQKEHVGKAESALTAHTFAKPWYSQKLWAPTHDEGRLQSVDACVLCLWTCLGLRGFVFVFDSLPFLRGKPLVQRNPCDSRA